MAALEKERRGDARRESTGDRASTRPARALQLPAPSTGNAPIVFSAALFVIAFLVVGTCGLAVTGGIDIWIICPATAVAVLAIFTVRIAPQWERVVILRFKLQPGPRLTIPFSEPTICTSSHRLWRRGDADGRSRAHQRGCRRGRCGTRKRPVWRWRTTTTLWPWRLKRPCATPSAARTWPTWPCAACSWMTSAPSHRGEKTSTWGVSILFVEIRDIVIPKELQESMAAGPGRARARRAGGARRGGKRHRRHVT